MLNNIKDRISSTAKKITRKSDSPNTDAKGRRVEENKKAKILYLDIESMAHQAWVWQRWDTNVIEFIDYGFLLSFAYKWEGDKKVTVKGLPDYDLYDNEPHNDLELCKDLQDLLEQASVVIAHNGDQFDIPMIMARLAYHGLTPPPPLKTVDTRKVARRYFRFDSNSLQHLADFFGIKGKLKHDGFKELWIACYEGDKSAWKRMLEYNAQDVNLLEEIYKRLRPWITQHPNLNLINGTMHTCPVCGGNKLQKRGFHRTRVTQHQRYQCQSCGAWSHAPNNRMVR